MWKMTTTTQFKFYKSQEALPLDTPRDPILVTMFGRRRQSRVIAEA
jgi:hypothetical protein